MRVNGLVSRVEEGYAWVDVTVAQGCGRCSEPGGCGGVNIARPLGSSVHAVRVLNEVGALPGDAVGVLVDDGIPLRAALVAYAWPVVGVLIGAALGTVVASPGSADLLAGFGALAGGMVAAVASRRHAAWAKGGELPLRLEKSDAHVRECGR